MCHKPFNGPQSKEKGMKMKRKNKWMVIAVVFFTMMSTTS
jgi:hypothetical protein